MRKPVTKKIGKTTYRVTPLGAKQGCKVFTRLANLLGSGLKGAGPGMDRFAAFGTALESLKDSDFEYFCDAFAPVTEFNTGDQRWPHLSDFFDDHFAGNYLEMLEWLEFAVEVNFGDFFDAVKEKLAPRSTVDESSAPPPAA